MVETELKLYNTLTRSKEPFTPIDAKNVRMYVCGPTVYDYAHIGNARPVIVFDVLYRLLRHIYGEKHVTHVRNITDIDDKINKRAFDRWTKKRPLLDEVKALTQITAAQYEADVAALGCLPPTHSPRATDFVCNGEQPMDMVRVIEKLVAKGFAYEAAGHVLFEVGKMPTYGTLSRRSLDDMIAGARVEIAPYKRSPMDFVLWKPSDPALEPGWDSPWGFGRPGWHIECSAMSGALLGNTFDIHAGGLDLIFPHHENEIAQTCCAFGVDKMASVWMHNGFLQVEGQKMSKSAGNFFTIQDVLKDWPGEVVRLNMLKTHYRQPIDWTNRSLSESKLRLKRWQDFASERSTVPRNDVAFKEFVSALCDDLNIAEALKIIEISVNSLKMRESSRHSVFRMIRLLGFNSKVQKFKLSENGGRAILSAFSNRTIKNIDNIIDSSRLRPYHKNGRIRPHANTIAYVIAIRDWANKYLPDRVDFPPEIYKKIEDYSLQIKPHETDLESSVHRLLDARLDARRAKDFATSDRIRDELLAMGIQLKDGKDPVTGEPTTTWEVKR